MLAAQNKKKLTNQLRTILFLILFAIKIGWFKAVLIIVANHGLTQRNVAQANLLNFHIKNTPESPSNYMN